LPAGGGQQFPLINMFCVRIIPFIPVGKTKKGNKLYSENIQISYANLAGGDADFRQAVLYCFCLPYAFICRQTQHFLKEQWRSQAYPSPFKVHHSFVCVRMYD
jgi:hypothetical protein